LEGVSWLTDYQVIIQVALMVKAARKPLKAHSETARKQK
jgi:hypothetical protein